MNQRLKTFCNYIRLTEKSTLRNSRREAERTAFTLVELLVSTAIVVLIMMMFAQIYGSTIQTITLQRGIGNNDQRARTLNTLMLSDLRSITYRQTQSPTAGSIQGIVPLGPGDDSLLDKDRQKGYFYYSENDPLNDTDDVLQFTAMIGTSASVGDQTTDSSKVFMGRATSLPASPLSGQQTTNQPDFDDKVLDGFGQSRAAEICYFVRGGNLYRRVFLLRDPAYATPPLDEQPGDSAGNALYNSTTYRNYAGSNPYLSDFDYSATRAGASGADYLWFNGIDSLDNSFDPPINNPIAISRYRYGFESNPGSATLGLPREYNSSGNFYGRFTMEETSSTAFTWPGNASTAYPVSSALDANGILSNFSGGQRTGEDLLLTNVEGFDIKAYDDSPNGKAFFDLGQGPTFSVASSNPGYTSGYTPAGAWSAIFDTWHPANLSGTVSGSPSRSNPPILLRNISTYTVQRDPSPIATSWSLPATPPVGSYFAPRDSTAIIFKVVDNSSGSGVTAGTEPSWPLQANSPTFADGGVTWQCIDNRVGLKAIQITIRYRDPSRELAKQVTLVHSFVE